MNTKSCPTLLLAVILSAPTSAHTGFDRAQASERRDFQARAAGSDFGVAALERWSFGLNLDAVVNDEPQSLGHEAFQFQPESESESDPDMGLESFLFSGESERFEFRLGHHQPTDSGLLFDGNTHMGFSADVRVDGLGGEVSVFGVPDGEPGEQRQGYAGGAWRSSLDTRWSDVTVSARYLTGRESGDSPRHSSGRRVGYALGLDSQWFDERLNLEIEKALTRLHAGTDESQGRGDGAYSAALVFRPELSNLPLGWQLGAEITDVGAHFRSPANQPVSEDQSRERVFTRLSAERWTLNSSVALEEKNLERRDTLPATRNVNQQVSLNYRSPDLFATQWLKSPVYDLKLERVVTDDLDQRDTYTPRDRVERALTFSSHFLNPLGSWSMGYSVRECEAGADNLLDSRGDEVFADATLTLSDRLWIKPSGHFQRERKTGRSVTAYHTFIGLTADAQLIPDQLSWRQRIELNRTRGVDDPLLARNNGKRYVSGELNWQAIAPLRQRPGLDLNLSFSADQMQSTRDNGGGLDSYEVLLSVESRFSGS